MKIGAHAAFSSWRRKQASFLVGFHLLLATRPILPPLRVLCCCFSQQCSGLVHLLGLIEEKAGVEAERSGQLRCRRSADCWCALGDALSTVALLHRGERRHHLNKLLSQTHTHTHRLTDSQTAPLQTKRNHCSPKWHRLAQPIFSRLMDFQRNPVKMSPISLVMFKLKVL